MRASRAYGLTLVTIAAILWSTGGLFVRILDLDVWTILAWRSLFAALSLVLLFVAKNRGQAVTALTAIGWPGLVAIPLSVVSIGGYVVALKLTSVANVMIVYATVPFIAAGVGFVWMGEKAGSRVLTASAIALAGIVIMAAASIRPADVAGNLVALVMTIAFGTQLVMARRYPALNMMSINAIGAALCGMMAWPLAHAGLPDHRQLLILAVFGVTTTSLAYLLFLTGGRYVPSGEAGLVGLIDVVLSPLWVWLAFAEEPGIAALVGGAVVLASVLYYLAGEPWVVPGASP
jgi:drug/metabolite transporter (DMT)-like permease